MFGTSACDCPAGWGGERCETKAASGMVNHSLWGQVLRKHVHVGGVADGIRTTLFDYEALRASYHRNTADGATFRRYLKQLETTDLAQLGANERKALLANAYNAFVVKLMVTHNCTYWVWPPRPPHFCSSIRDVKSSTGGAPWGIKIGRLGGSLLSLDDIEHGYLRASCSGNTHARALAGLPSLPCDPRMHGALNCGSVSCPDLLPEPFEGPQIDAQLDAHVRGWLANTGKGLSVRSMWGISNINASSLFKWYGTDFKPDVVHFLAKYGPAAQRGAILASSKTAFKPYDWHANAWTGAVGSHE